VCVSSASTCATNATNAKAFQDSFAISYPSLFDPPGRVTLGFDDVPPTVVPAPILLDRQLNIAAVFRKRVHRKELEAAIRVLAAEDSATGDVS